MVDVEIEARGDPFLARVLLDDALEFRALHGVPRRELPGLLLVPQTLFPSLRQLQRLRRNFGPKIIKLIRDLLLLNFLDVLVLFILEAHKILLVILTKLFDAQFALV